MGDGTGIQWTDATWNPLRARHLETGAEGWSCGRVSPGCKNCYASTLNETQRWSRGTGLDYTVPNLERVEHYLDARTLTQPLRWKKGRRVFVCSMTDLFGEWVTDEQLDRVFAVMALTPEHTYQVLTKRPERMQAYLSKPGDELADRWHAANRAMAAPTGIVDGYGPGDRSMWDPPLPNVWLGASVEDQVRADERIPLLIQTPAAVRFLSCEPLLGRIEFADVSGRSDAVEQWGQRALTGIDWVIVGGESGAGARPFDLAWARSIVEQCQTVDVAVFVKQLGAKPVDDPRAPTGQFRDGPNGSREYEYTATGVRLKHNHGGNPDEWPEELRVREWPAAVVA